MLQDPGLNAATLGVLAMTAIHALLWGLNRSGVEIGPVYYDWCGLSLEGLAAGRVWQLITHAWLHGNWFHLWLNALLFYYAAARLSHFMSGWRIMGLFTVCSVGAGMAHIVSQLLFPELPGLVGASGGVTGMLLAFFCISPDSRMLLFHVSASNLAKGVLIASALLFLMSPDLNLPVLSSIGSLAQEMMGPGIFQAAHLVHFVGGILGWVLVSRFLPRLLNQDDLMRMRLEQEVRNEVRWDRGV